MSASMKSAKAAAPYPDEGTSRKTQTFCRKERRLYLSGFILILLLLSVRLPDVTSFGMSVLTRKKLDPREEALLRLFVRSANPLRRAAFLRSVRCSSSANSIWSYSSKLTWIVSPSRTSSSSKFSYERPVARWRRRYTRPARILHGPLSRSLSPLGCSLFVNSATREGGGPRRAGGRGDVSSRAGRKRHRRAESRARSRRAANSPRRRTTRAHHERAKR